MANLNLRGPQTASSLEEMQTVRNLLLNRNFQWLCSNVAQQAGLAVGIDSTGAACLGNKFCEANDWRLISQPPLFVIVLNVNSEKIKLKSLWNNLLIF